MSLTRLVLDVAREGLLLAETCRQFLGRRQIAAAIAADVDDQSVAEQHIADDLVEVAFTEVVHEAAYI